jgi:hypothetical protein
MSIIGHSSLNKIVKENGVKRPSESVGRVNTEIVDARLQGMQKGVRDGMDVSRVS